MTEGRPKTVLAIDPGSSKCGLALVRREESGECTVVWRQVAPTEELAGAATAARGQAEFELVVVGSGTRSRPVVQTLRELWPGAAILVIDERDTSVKARERYWAHTQRRGWRRFVPATLQTPPEPIDDFAAVVLAERVLSC